MAVDGQEATASGARLVVLAGDGGAEQVCEQESCDAAVGEDEEMSGERSLTVDPFHGGDDATLRVDGAFPAFDALMRVGKEAVGMRLEGGLFEIASGGAVVLAEGFDDTGRAIAVGGNDGGSLDGLALMAAEDAGPGDVARTVGEEVHPLDTAFRKTPVRDKDGGIDRNFWMGQEDDPIHVNHKKLWGSMSTRSLT